MTVKIKYINFNSMRSRLDKLFICGTQMRILRTYQTL